MSESSLAPTLLLAMPQMQDPNFARSVVLLCKHEREGAMGLVVNRLRGWLAVNSAMCSSVMLQPTSVRAG